MHGIPERHAVDGLEDREGGRRRHRRGEAEGGKPRTQAGSGANGVVEGYKAAEQEEEPEVLSEVHGGPYVAACVLPEDGGEVHRVFPGRMEDLRNGYQDDANG